MEAYMIIFTDQVPTKPDSGHWIFDKKSLTWLEETPNSRDIALDIFICGFPRSGNNFLLTATSLAYHISQHGCVHTVEAIRRSNKVFVPFRNPLDCIPSWMRLRNESVLDVVNHYCRFSRYVIDNAQKCVLLDFDEFSRNLNYFFDAVLGEIGLAPCAQTNRDLVISSLMKKKPLNLSVKSASGAQFERQCLIESGHFEEVADIHKKLKSICLQQSCLRESND
jgi:hypothetical protein